MTGAPASDVGEGPAHSLLVERVSVVAEKEPNDGFREAQRVALPQEIQGQINRDQDVDLFCFEGRAGQKIFLEVRAARYGSALDFILTLDDAKWASLKRPASSSLSSTATPTLARTREPWCRTCLRITETQTGTPRYNSALAA